MNSTPMMIIPNSIIVCAYIIVWLLVGRVVNRRLRSTIYRKKYKKVLRVDILFVIGTFAAIINTIPHTSQLHGKNMILFAAEIIGCLGAAVVTILNFKELFSLKEE